LRARRMSHIRLRSQINVPKQFCIQNEASGRDEKVRENMEFLVEI